MSGRRFKPSAPVRWGELGAVSVAGVVLAIALLLPAIELRYGSETESFSLLQLQWLGPIVLAVSVIAVVVTAVEILMRRTGRSSASWTFGGLALFLVIAIIAAEGLDVLIPRDLLPTTVRRFTLAMGTRPALWFAMIACLVILLVGRGRLSIVIERMTRRQEESAAMFAVRLASGATSVAGVWLVMAGRNAPLVRGSAAGADVEVSAWALPVVGPLSLVLLFVLAGCAAFVFFDVEPIASALVGSAAAWMVATANAITVATSGLVMKGQASDWWTSVVGKTGAVIDDLDSGAGGVMGFWGALLVAGSLTAVLAVGRPA